VIDTRTDEELAAAIVECADEDWRRGHSTSLTMVMLLEERQRRES